MVSVTRFLADAENITYEIERRLNKQEENAAHYFVVTRTIQKIFRGYTIRKHLGILNEKAIYIQKSWRGFLGRAVYETLLKERYDQLCRSYYAAAAVTVQRHWKGYWVRTRIFSFNKLKSWLEFVDHQNKYLKSATEKYRKVQNKHELEKREEEAKEWIIYILFKLHHLLRTHQISGIYSLSKTSKLSDIEKMLTCLKYKDFMTFYNSYKADVREKKAKEMPPYILQNCKYVSHFEREWHEHKLLHKDSYTEKSEAKDRYTRYEIHEGIRDNVVKVDLGTCECSFCLNTK